MMLRRIKALIVVALASMGVAVAVPGVATADVVVQPGASGHICTSTRPYDYFTSTLYWQICAWADNNEVYFTAHFGNTASTGVSVDVIDLGYIRNGYFAQCPVIRNFSVPAKSVRGTPTDVCAIPRSRAAYQADIIATESGDSRPLLTDSLQVL